VVDDVTRIEGLVSLAALVMEEEAVVVKERDEGDLKNALVVSTWPISSQVARFYVGRCGEAICREAA